MKIKGNPQETLRTFSGSSYKFKRATSSQSLVFAQKFSVYLIILCNCRKVPVPIELIYTNTICYHNSHYELLLSLLLPFTSWNIRLLSQLRVIIATRTLRLPNRATPNWPCFYFLYLRIDPDLSIYLFSR